MNILFDLDGTLTDPRVGIVGCIRFALAQLDMKIDESVELESFIGPPLRDTFRQLCGDNENADRAVSYYRERFAASGLFENRVYDGVPACLDRLNGTANAIHVATSKPTIYAEKIVRHFGLDHYLDRVYGADLDGTHSDKTDLIGHILNSEGLRPQDTVMIGDRSFDMEGARNNGVRAMGVLWGFGSERELTEAGADGLCRHPDEIYGQVFK